MAVTTIIASGERITVQADYEAVQNFWVTGSGENAIFEYTTTDGDRTTVAATAIETIIEERTRATARCKIGFVK